MLPDPAGERLVSAEHPVLLALDCADTAAARTLAQAAAPYVGGYKLGLRYFLSQGAAGYRAIAELGREIFLDLKFHDIPNTVADAVAAVAPLAPRYLTIHAAGGSAMISAARRAAPAATEVIAVTVLTSLSDQDLAAVGQGEAVAEQVSRLGALAIEAGADGLVCSPAEVAGLRNRLGRGPRLIVPGIRPAGSAKGDQKRVMTPRKALTAGADRLVIGRPISAASDPAAAAAAITEEIMG